MILGIIGALVFIFLLIFFIIIGIKNENKRKNTETEHEKEIVKEWENLQAENRKVAEEFNRQDEFIILEQKFDEETREYILLYKRIKKFIKDSIKLSEIIDEKIVINNPETGLVLFVIDSRFEFLDGLDKYILLYTDNYMEYTSKNFAGQDYVIYDKEIENANIVKIKTIIKKWDYIKTFLNERVTSISQIKNLNSSGIKAYNGYKISFESKCPNCGGSMKRQGIKFICHYCGTEL